MQQTALLEFESTAFPARPSEDEATNPGIHGQALAEWLAERLRAAGTPAGEVISEDFGWCIRVESSPHALFVACASADDEPDHWRVFAFAEGGLVARLLGRDRRASSLAALFTAVRACLEAEPEVRELREEPA